MKSSQKGFGHKILVRKQQPRERGRYAAVLIMHTVANPKTTKDSALQDTDLLPRRPGLLAGLLGLGTYEEATLLGLVSPWTPP